MRGKITNYYAGGNTARGFYSLFDSNLRGLQRLFILKGGPGTGKSVLMKKVGQQWAQKGYDIEYMHCSSDNDSIDGVIITALKAGIVDGTAPHVIEPKFDGIIDEYVNLNTALHTGQLRKNKETIISLTLQVSEAFQSAYRTFAEAFDRYDEWKSLYARNLDFAKLEKLANKLTTALLPEKKTSAQAEIRHRFSGAATPKGPADFICHLTEGLPKRYFLTGRPGSGKSTLLKKLSAAAEQKGYNVEMYHCGFDPDSLDMVIVRERGFAMFDSTAPHEYEPNREGDEIIDLYNEVIKPGTDEKYAAIIQDISRQYSAKTKEGIQFLAKAKALRDQLESYYIEAMDFSKIDCIYEEINSEIEYLVADK